MQALQPHLRPGCSCPVSRLRSPPPPSQPLHPSPSCFGASELSRGGSPLPLQQPTLSPALSLVSGDGLQREGVGRSEKRSQFWKNSQMERPQRNWSPGPGLGVQECQEGKDDSGSSVKRDMERGPGWTPKPRSRGGGRPGPSKPRPCSSVLPGAHPPSPCTCTPLHRWQSTGPRGPPGKAFKREVGRWGLEAAGVWPFHQAPRRWHPPGDSATKVPTHPNVPRVGFFLSRALPTLTCSAALASTHPYAPVLPLPPAILVCLTQVHSFPLSSRLWSTQGGRPAEQGVPTGC